MIKELEMKMLFEVVRGLPGLIMMNSKVMGVSQKKIEVDSNEGSLILQL